MLAVLQTHGKEYPCIRRLNLYVKAKGVRAIHERGKGEALEHDVFMFRDAKGIERYMVNIGAMHSIFGDMAAEIARIALNHGVRDLVFSGSAGAVRTDFPYYSLIVPGMVKDHQGRTVADGTDNRFNLYVSQIDENDSLYLTPSNAAP